LSLSFSYLLHESLATCLLIYNLSEVGWGNIEVYHWKGILLVPSLIYFIFSFLFFTGSFVGKIVQDFWKMLVNQVDLVRLRTLILFWHYLCSILQLLLLTHVNMDLLCVYRHHGVDFEKWCIVVYHIMRHELLHLLFCPIFTISTMLRSSNI
jgi:hypothetical protein